MPVTYPAQLPVSARREDIAAAIRDHQVVVVAGETGSGKTTQLPKICLDLGRGSRRRIGHTQPRRIAARSVAERIASELGSELGETVGYQVRFTDKTSAASSVKVMTDGILLAELQHDRDLLAYDTLIIDEAHERSLNIDFILGYLKRLLPRRPDLKVVITSATIDPERFARHFADAAGEPAPVIEVSGRTYPVEVRYRPLMLEVDESDDPDEEGELVVRDQTEAVADAVTELCAEGQGDILVFLPGEREIRDTAEELEALAARTRPGFDVLPLYARLSAAEQHRVFAPHTRRRVVLATNVAETSLTVPGIRYVIDSGVARISRYSTRSKVQRLPIEPISQASARQRAGRCGRVEAGICIRLYAEEDFEGRPEFTDPEILRTNLASVILQMASLRLGEVERFPFVEPPDRRNVRAGVELLTELGAVAPAASGASGGQVRLTNTGRRLARLPIDPRLARMILEADRRGCLREVLVIAAALSVQDPRERPVEKQAQADQLHARFKDPSSDFLTWLTLWRHLRERQQAQGSSAFRREVRGEFLNYVRIREWQDYESQLRRVAKDIGLTVGQPADEPDADAIHQSLLAGLLSHVGLRDAETRDYLGARGTRFSIFPGSGLAKKQPQLVMAAELVETSRLFGRTNAGIKAEWAERLGAHLVKRSYAEPHWSRKRAAVVARERVTLYGVPLVADRLVQYGTVDRELSRELFIRHALVYGEWSTRQRFFHHNRELLEEVGELEHRARRRDLVVDEHTMFDFYDERVGADVVSGAHFDSWWKQVRREQPDLLTFDPAMLVNEAAAGITDEQFPTSWRSEDLTLPIDYRFEPGSAHDGLTIEVPVAVLNRVGADQFSWLVPGLREELVIALLRSLPKNLRTSFVPAPDHAARFLAEVPAGEEPLLDALERWCRATTGVHVPREAWDLSRLPDHLRPTYAVVDASGARVGEGKDLDALKAPLRGSFDDAIAEVAAEAGMRRSGMTTWEVGTLERTVTTVRAGQEVRVHPALVDEGTTVGLRVCGSTAEQEAVHREGVRRLALLAAPSVRRTLKDALDNTAKLEIAGTPYASVGDLLADCGAAVVTDLVDEALTAEGGVWDRAAYDALVARVRAEVPARASEVLAEVRRVLAAWREADRALTGRADIAQLPALTDMRAQVARLVHDGFVGEVGAARLRHLARYLRAVGLRRARLEQAPTDDRRKHEAVAPLQQSWLHRVEALPAGRPPGASLREARWLIEEYRVSLWAQQLGTAQKVSDKRIRTALDGS
ncbi:ATP-dependent RNA helicase HrpA [Nocardioidaceae bacterium]|nr:ATP-dependent RNA helicase HrpA [Nocardioidaceae bacterium]